MGMLESVGMVYEGKVTLIEKRRRRVSQELQSNHGTLAIRSKHPNGFSKLLQGSDQVRIRSS